MPPRAGLALFDFDNTITIADSYSRFLRHIATPEQTRRARWALGPALFGFRIGLVSARALRERATHFAFAGKEATVIRAHGSRFATETLPTLECPRMLRRIARHKTRGDTVVVVSASLDLYLRPWCERHGLELICNRLEQRDGRLTGRYHGGDIGTRKVERIQAHYDLDTYAVVYAYGDSREDRPMLALAHHRWYRGRQIR